ncbi:Dolichol kinase [Nakaseomyces bracarensis]|uniref:dolichol kinase n=1 Tax=Nakaseomyces bracarensis TaxID=273131 RepID=A0ABR4NXX2_9SACH
MTARMTKSVTTKSVTRVDNRFVIAPQIWQILMMLGPLLWSKDSLMSILATNTLLQVVVGLHVSHAIWKGRRFEEIYRIYLPFLVSYAFCDEKMMQVNIVMSLNGLFTTLDATINSQLFNLAGQIVVLQVFFPYEQISAIKGLIINHLVDQWLEDIGELKSLDQIDCNLFSILITNCFMMNGKNIPNYFLVLKGTLLSLIMVITINHILVKFNKSLTHSLILLTNIGTLFPIFVNLMIDFSRETIKSPIMWLIHFIQESQIRQFIICGWASILITFIPLVLLFKSKISLNTSRKIWHFMIFLLIVKPFKLDPEFVKIALCGTIPCFLTVEYIRYLKIEPYGTQLDTFLRSFADHRDQKGPLIVSYIYLITGISIPLLLFDSPVGLISLGVGDSLASIVGKKIGRVKWLGTAKTVEGTIAFIAGTTIISLILKYYLNYFSTVSVFDILLLCSAGGILEGNSELNDNILIPIFMVSMEKILTH